MPKKLSITEKGIFLDDHTIPGVTGVEINLLPESTEVVLRFKVREIEVLRSFEPVVSSEVLRKAVESAMRSQGVHR